MLLPFFGACREKKAGGFVSAPSEGTEKTKKREPVLFAQGTSFSWIPVYPSRDSVLKRCKLLQTPVCRYFLSRFISLKVPRS